MCMCSTGCVNLTPGYRGGLYHLFEIGVFFVFFKMWKYTNFVNVIISQTTLSFQHEPRHVEMRHGPYQKLKKFHGTCSLLWAVLPDISPIFEKFGVTITLFLNRKKLKGSKKYHYLQSSDSMVYIALHLKWPVLPEQFWVLPSMWKTSYIKPLIHICTKISIRKCCLYLIAFLLSPSLFITTHITTSAWT